MCMEAWSSDGWAWRLGVVMDVMETWSSDGCAWRLGLVMDVHGGLE